MSNFQIFSPIFFTKIFFCPKVSQICYTRSYTIFRTYNFIKFGEKKISTSAKLTNLFEILQKPTYIFLKHFFRNKGCVWSLHISFVVYWRPDSKTGFRMNVAPTVFELSHFRSYFSNNSVNSFKFLDPGFGFSEQKWFRIDMWLYWDMTWPKFCCVV